MARNSIDVVVKGDYQDKDINRAIRDLKKLQAASDSMGSQMQTMGGQMQSVGAGIGKVGKALTLGVTLPIVGIGIAAVASQADFEMSMNSLQVNANASAKQMESLSALALQMGADTVFSAGEAANAMLELSKGGLGVADIQAGALASTMALAATEGMDLARAAEIVAQGMNTFGMEAKETGKIADLLAAGAVASTAGVEDLAGGLKYVGVTANQFGIGLGDSVTALASLNNAGIDATTAGTSLNRFFLGLAGTTKKGADTMKEFGLEFFNAQGEMRPMTEIIAELDTKLGDLTDKERTKVMKDLFGIEGMRAANVLIQEGVVGFESLSTAVNKQGVAADLANARMSGTAGALEQLRGSLESAAIQIGQVLAPMIQQVAGFLQGMADRFQSLSPAVQQFVVFAGIAAAALGPLLLVVGGLVSTFGTLLAGIGAIASAGGLAAVAAAAAPVIAAVAAVIAVVGGLAVGLVVLWTQSQAFRDAVISVFEAVKSAIVSAVDSIKAKLDENKQKLDMLKAGFQAAFEFVEKYVMPVIATLVGTQLKMMVAGIGFVINALITIISTFIDFGVALFNAGVKVYQFATSVGEAIGSVVEFFEELPGSIVTAIGNAGTILLDTGKNIVMGLWNGIVGAKDWLIGKITGWIKDVLPDPVERFLGISSPSKLFEGIGLNSAEGLAQGLTKGKGSVLLSATDLAQSVATQSSAQFATIGRMSTFDFLEGMIQEFLPSGRKRKMLMAVIDDLAASMSSKLNSAASVGGSSGSAAPLSSQSGYVPFIDQNHGTGDPFAGGIPGLFGEGDAAFQAYMAAFNAATPFAKGGIVTSPMLGLVGEAGPEAIIPLSRSGNSGIGATINLTVNAGMGTQGAEVGRQIVEAIRSYERSSGRVFAGAA